MAMSDEINPAPENRDGNRPPSSAAHSLAEQLHNLKFELYHNAAYHNDLLSFYSGMHRLVSFITTFAGTAFISSLLLENRDFGIAASGVVTIAATSDLVFDLTGRARIHEILRSKSYNLLSELERTDIDETLLSTVRRKLISQWEEGPPIKYGVSILAWNTAMVSITSTAEIGDKLIPLPLWRRLLRHILAFSPDTFRKLEDRRERQRQLAREKAAGH